MNFIQRIFKKKTSADKIADARQKYFDTFLELDYTGYGANSECMGVRRRRNPDEAMQLADKVVVWLYSPTPRRTSGASGANRGRR